MLSSKDFICLENCQPHLFDSDHGDQYPPVLLSFQVGMDISTEEESYNNER